MAEFSEENKVEGVFGGVDFGSASSTEGQSNSGETKQESVFTKVETGNLPTKPSIWTKIKAFLFQEIDLNAPIKVELTPYQQKVEDEINEFLHQEISFKGFFNIFKKKNAQEQ